MSYESDRNPAEFYTMANRASGDAGIAYAILAMAAEIRTSNQIAFLNLRATGVSKETLAPIAERVGMDHGMHG